MYGAFSWNIAKKMRGSGEPIQRGMVSHSIAIIVMLFVWHCCWPGFLGPVILSYPMKISSCEYNLKIISQPVLFIACFFSLSVVWSVKSLLHYILSFCCPYENKFDLQTSRIEPIAVINMIGKQTIIICSKCKYKDTFYLAQSTLVNVFQTEDNCLNLYD
jgi:hypothetical protein